VERGTFVDGKVKKRRGGGERTKPRTDQGVRAQGKAVHDCVRKGSYRGKQIKFTLKEIING